MLNNDITHVDITLHDHIELEIITTKEKSFRISESQFGEYQQAIVLSSAVKDKTLYISDPQSPTFNYPNDKLSAHKVVDGKATLYVPEGKTIFITAESADVTLTGTFKNITVNLKNGKCHLENVSGNFQIVTVYAPVHVQAAKTKVTAQSKNGIIINKSRPTGTIYSGKIESINGSITVE
jgi:HSP20 family molecular chaperone IbpA